MYEEGSSKPIHDDHGSKFSTERPCMFYKLMVDSIIQDKKLKIPKKFVKKYGHELFTIAILAVPGSCEWPVEICRVGKKFWFGQGWYEFLEYQSINAGYFLIFSYEGNSKFSVFVYNLACSGTQCSCMPRPSKSSEEADLEKQCSVACEESVWPPTLSSQKESSSLKKRERLNPHLEESRFQKKVQYTRNTGVQTDNIELEQSTDRKGLNPAYEAKSTNKRKERTKDDVDVHVSSSFNEELGPKLSIRSISAADIRMSRNVKTGERQRAFRASSMCIPVNPFCRVILPPSFQHQVHIPRSFATKHFGGYPSAVTLQLSDGKLWPVNCINGGKGSAKLCKGWKKFAQDNNLEEGDICVFELIKMKEIVLKVIIFRVHEDAGPANQF